MIFKPVFILIALLIIGCSHVQTKDIAKTLVGVGAGIGSGLMTHEIGHHIAINQKDQVDNVVWTSPATFELITETTPASGRLIATSGIMADVVSEEVLHWMPVNDFTLGWHLWNIFGGGITAVRGYSDSSSGGRDYSLYEKYGGDRKGLAVARLGYSILSAYRLYGNKKFQTYIDGNGLLNLQWRW